MAEIIFACPNCVAALNDRLCPKCQREYPVRAGIHRFLPPERVAEIAEFLDQYRLVRKLEGHRALSTDEYRALPLMESGSMQADLWRVRRESYDRLIQQLGPRPLRILDLGAGNGWLSNRLTSLGHECVAVDWLDDAEDGLGAYHHYETRYICIQADFNALPFMPAQFDVAIFNASLHYAPSLEATLFYVNGMLVEGGQLFILDSPTFRSDYSGCQMLIQQEAHLRALTGRTKIVRPGIGFLTRRGMMEAGRLTGHKFSFHPSFGGLNWAARRWWSWVKLRREPAAFGVWYGIMNKKVKADVSKPSFILRVLRKRLAHGWLTIWNFIFGRHRYNRLVIEQVDGVSLIVLPEVYNPVLFRTGAFLARAVNITPFLRGSHNGSPSVLDLGCGSGIGAIFAVQRGARVIATDLNPEAVRCAGINAMLNHLEDRFETRIGDLFAPVENERFDMILFNPPFYRGHPRDDLDMAWRGENIFERFAAELKDHLTPTGLAMIVLSTHGDGHALLVQLDTNGFVSTPILSRDYGNEVITVYSVIPCQPPSLTL